MPDYTFTQTGAELQVIFDAAETLSDTDIKVGFDAGITNQGSNAVAVGNGAGKANQDFDSVAIGKNAGGTSQSDRATSIGPSAGEINQGSRSIAIGPSAGSFNQGAQSIAIGSLAGDSSQPANSIVVSADNVNVTPAAVGDILLHSTTTDLLANATKLELNGIIIAGSAMKTGTLASPPTGMVAGEQWLDTTGSAVHPLIRKSTINT